MDGCSARFGRSRGFSRSCGRRQAIAGLSRRDPAGGCIGADNPCIRTYSDVAFFQTSWQASRRGSDACLAQPCGLPASNFCSRRRAFNRHCDDDGGRHHGRQFPSDRRYLDGRPVAGRSLSSSRWFGSRRPPSNAFSWFSGRDCEITRCGGG